MHSNKDRLLQAVSRWNDGDLDGYLQLYDPSIRLHGYSPEPMDKAGTTAFYQTLFSALPQAGKRNPRLEILDLIEADDEIVCRFHMAGVHAGPFMTIPATGRDYVLPGITILKFAHGKVIERWSSADMLGLLIQLGAIPSANG